MLICVFACNKEDENPELEPGQKEAIGTVWRSGGLFYCHAQIRTEKGDTLIPMENGRNAFHYSGGQRVHVIYLELKDFDPGCNGVACKIIKTELIE